MSTQQIIESCESGVEPYNATKRCENCGCLLYANDNRPCKWTPTEAERKHWLDYMNQFPTA